MRLAQIAVLGSSSQGGQAPELPQVATIDLITLDPFSSLYVWLYAQDVDTEDTDQYENGLKLFTDKTGNNNNASQSTEANRPTVSPATINGLTNIKTVIFDGVNDYLDTGLNGSEFATTLEFELHFLIKFTDGRPGATKHVFGGTSASNTNNRCGLSLLADGKLQFQLGNGSGAFIPARTTAQLPDGETTVYIRVRVDKGANQISIYTGFPSDGQEAVNDIIDALALESGFGGDITSLDSVTDFGLNLYLGARNDAGSVVNPTAMSLMDFKVTPLLTDTQAQDMYQLTVYFMDKVADFVEITTTDGEIGYIDKIGDVYYAICRHMHQDPPPSDYPTDLFFSEDLTTFEAYEDNPVFDAGVTYSAIKHVLKKDGMYIGAYTTKDDVDGVPVSQKEEVGIATSTDLINWTNLGVVLSYTDLGTSRVMPGPIKFQNGMYYMVVQVPETGSDLNDRYEMHLYSSPNLTEWTFVKVMLANSGEDDGPGSSIKPLQWVEVNNKWYLFYEDTYNGPHSSLRVAWSNSMLGDYTIMEGNVLRDFWFGHPEDPAGGSGEGVNMNYGMIYHDEDSGNYYYFYNLRDQSMAPFIGRTIRRVPITFS